MKKHLLIMTILLLSTTARSQETITLSGGVVVARAIDYSSFYPVDYKTNATGFRITGTYEIGPLEPKKFIHGFSMAYVLTKATVDEPNLNLDLSVRTIPMYYAPKYMIGSDKAMAFAKGAIGMQFVKFESMGTLEEKDHDWGFYGGVGLGGMVYLSKKAFLNLEYEWAYLSNTYYANGVISSVQLGFGLDL